MLNIKIDKDNFAYLTTDDSYLFKLIEKSLTREVRKFNNWFKFYENKKVKHYSLVNNGTKIKFKAGLVQFLCNSFNKRGIRYNIEDKRNYLSISAKQAVIKLNDDVTLRNYQQQAVKSVFNSNGYGCLQLPTGSGKSEIAASIIRTYLNYYFNRAVVYVVPTIKLQKEAKERFESYSIPCNTELPFVIGCANIITYASMVRAEIKTTDKDKVGALIFDESHHLKGAKSSRIIHQYKKLNMCIGLSATIAIKLSEKKYLNQLTDEDLNILGCVGYPLYIKEIEETIKEKYVTPIEICVLDNPEDVVLTDDEMSDWHTVKKLVLMTENRANLIAKLLKQLVEKDKLNTVCLLIPEVKWSQHFMTQVANAMQDKKDARFILTYGGNKYDEIVDGHLIHLNGDMITDAENDIRDPNKLTIFSATTYFFEGINITNIQAVINVYGGRSSTRVKQQVGRAVRLFEGKEIAYIYEIWDKNPIFESQLKTRLNIYKKEYNAEIKKIKLED